MTDGSHAMNTELTPIEQAFQDAAQSKIPDLESQQWVTCFRVDFMVRSHRLIIELDGHEYHKTREQRTADASRQRALQLEGWTVIRFTGTEIYHNVSSCVDQTIELLALLPLADQDEPESKVFCCIRMQEVLMHLCDKYGIEFSRNFYAKLTLGPNWLPLSIEKNGRVLSIRHFYEENHDIVYDSVIEFYITNQLHDYPDWIPLNMQNRFRFTRCADVKDEEEDIFSVSDPNAQRDIADFAEIWAKNLRNQGWFENGTVCEYNKWDSGD
jgi:very-short-patch-repair endonuclease